MALGAYSIVRFSNHLNDQRVNLGVLLWHPLDGFRYRFTPAVERIQAIDPRIQLKPVRNQLDVVRTELEQRSEEGRPVLESLARWFREGLQVTAPYPAQVFDADETLEQLYESLVSPVPEIRRASTQAQFEKSFRRALHHAVSNIAAGGRVEDVGVKRLNGVELNVGLRAIVGKTRVLWRALSLQSVDHPADQVAKAKATAYEVSLTKELPQFKNDVRCVALQSPKPKSSQSLTDSVAWLRHAADDVVVVQDTDALTHAVETQMRRTH